MLSRCLSLLEDIPCACLALLCQIYSQMQEAVLQLLWSWTPGWIQTTCTSLAPFWYSTGKEDPAAAPPRRASFAFGSFVISRIIRLALSRCMTLLLGGPCACLALLCHIRSQLQKAALQLLWSWTPGWIQATCTILAFLWHNAGKEGPAAASPGTASFGFGEFVVTIVRRARPSGAPPSPSGTVVAPAGALDPVPSRDTYGNDSSNDQHKSSVPDTQSAGSEATKVGFSLVIVC